MTITSIIDGTPWDGGTSGTLEIPNPAHLDEVVATASLADASGMATAAARAAVAQRDWARVPAPVRGEAIHAMGELFRVNKEALSQLVTREIGKPIAESRGEVQEAIDTCTFFASEGRRLYGQTVPSEMSDKQLFTFRNPVGVMAVITAGNFPVAVPSWYLVPALLAGNAVVWKPAEYTPAIADAVTRIVHAAGIPTARSRWCCRTGPPRSTG
jgi:alpha-ketoglutaric semialdehyde dehydrogenase